MPPPIPNTVTSASGLMNIGAPNLLHWRKAIAKVRDGTGRGRLVLIGDSTTAGAGAGTGGTLNYNGAYAKNWPRALGALLSATVPTSDNSFFGDQCQNVAYGTYDPRVVLGTGWAPTQNSLGGNMFHFTVGSPGTLAFTPAGQIDTITIYYLNATGTFTVNVDGGASLGTVTPSGTFLVSSQTFTVTKGAHTINMVAVNDAQVYVLGVVSYDSTTPAIDIIQTACSGSTASTFTSTGLGWSPMTVLAILAPDLTEIGLTINDSNAATALATYQTQMQAIITAAQLSGDALLMVGAPSNTANATNGTLDQYVGAVKSLALANNNGVVDLKTRWVSYAVTNPQLPYFDSLHPMRLGYRDIAQAVYEAIR